ncbi:MAG: anthranilate synthase component I family protein [Candidatus Eisenbacteria bacterium]|uniref:Anthranilate synthase component I family protein n=1 Tax=Eiseniibacteriota bacterium TaxID=2212470 RepID=A0A538SWW1_UNCEI|nr:MAG: anthranilate synthase component I family protein [Candidatus Eisenbacteria bacterium]
MLPSLAHPISRPIAIADPQAALAALAPLPHPFLLHSALEGEGARWSFFGADPFAIDRGERYEEAAAAWRRIARRFPTEAAPATSAPFTGGMVGYWAYDFGRRLERIPAVARDDLGLPDFVLGLYDVVGAFDHAASRAYLFSSGLPLAGAAGRERAEARLDDFTRRLESAEKTLAAGPRSGVRAVSTFTPDDYRRAVEKVKDHIRRGDIFQANLSQRWTVELPRGAVPGAMAWALEAALARRSQAPYAGFFDACDHAVACASPERFLTLRGRTVTTRPIKGTRPRGADPAQDRALRDALRASEKDRAENVMIVDVLRNDLGRVCEAGSVETPVLCELESFPQVHHLTSTVTGTLRPGLDALDLLHAAFPGGSITGAPKIRAMEILDALEPVRRHIYTGSLGYLDWRGDAEWNIAIRTALVTPRAVHFAAGGGITADSDAEAEYQETLHKAEGVRVALADLLGPVALEPAALHAR